MAEPSPVTPSTPQVLPRVLGLWDGIAVVVGSIIGSGIFLNIGRVDAALQPWGFGPIIGVWVVVGLVTLCGSLALGELAALYPHAGGPYVYLREAYGRPVAFLWGWTEFWVVRTGSIGALATATAIYLDKITPLGHVGQAVVAASIVIGLSLANMLSTRWGANLQNGFTAIKVLFLAGIIVLPVALGAAHLDHWSPLMRSDETGSFATALGIALMAVMWPYDGWINVAPVAEDIREPQRNVPLALAWGMMLIIVVYVGANLSYHLVLPMEQVAQSKAIVADLFLVLFGAIGAKLAAAGVMFSTFGATNSNMLCGPRIYLAMARDGLLPAAVHRLHRTRETPANAILLQSIWTLVLIVIFFAWKEDPKAAFDGLTDSVIIAGLIFYSLTVGAVFVLRSKHPSLPRPYRTWGYPLTPWLLIAVYAFALVQTLRKEPWQVVSVLALIGFGLVYYRIAIDWEGRRS